MKILITGGAGFIGSHFIRHILKKYRSYFLINLDKLTYAANLNNLNDVKGNPRYRFIKGDICNKRLVDKIVKDCQVVVNFAASTHVDRSITSPNEFIKTNIIGAYILLEAAKKYRIKRFIQISTDEVYGSSPRRFFKEDCTLNPSNLYSASKAAAEHIAKTYYKIHNLDVIITRSCNNFGPGQFPDKIIPLTVINALNSKPIPIYAQGLNVREWIFVDDNCHAIDLILHKGKKGEIYNIGTGNHLTNLNLSKKILKRLKRSADLITYVKDRPAHDFRYAMDFKKIKKLGWKPKYTFERALNLTIDWYANNQT